MMNLFRCFALIPAGLTHAKVAIAAARAGGVGLLDLEFSHKNEQELVLSNWQQLLNFTKPEEEIGLRLKENQVAHYKTLLSDFAKRSHWLVICDWSIDSLPSCLAALPELPNRQILLEVFSLEEAIKLESNGIQVSGLVAKGHEAGGWGSDTSAFILTQQLCQAGSTPIYVQGGIGIHTAAACRAAGAAGVFLDDQLWLMPESPLTVQMRGYLKNLNGQEAIIVGERLGQSYRVLSRPGFRQVEVLQSLAEELEVQQGDSPTRTRVWRQQAEALIGWGDPRTVACPMGQAVGLAAKFAGLYKTTGRLIQALLKASEEHIQKAKELRPLQPDSPLAVSHKTKFPIMQGPMTRVSDVAEFAQAIAQGGGLPMLALAMMRQSQVQTLLTQAQKLMAGRSWGVGILGFVPHALREKQLEVIRAIKPPFAIIAGGRPDQATKLEAEGIATYLHVPTPTLLKIFLEAGARRFIFEGRECGGHVGPLSSFVLWESMIDALLQHTPSGTESEVHVFFAGGIHDGRSAAMISCMAAPLAERGFRIGVLMGTAYTLTNEAVQHGAIVPKFQTEVLACKKTVNLETGPGHASRCAVTPFALEFYETRRLMTAAGESTERIKEALEDLTLGRLRVASKGLQRDATGDIVTVEEERQVADGMYMIGQVATLRDELYSVQKLHEDVCVTGTDYLSQLTSSSANFSSSKQADIAIVGIATLLPKANNPQQYWENILNKVDAITEIPQSRWDWRIYYDEDRHAKDKIYSKWGGFLDDVVFDPLRFGIPPKSLKFIEPMQLITLEAVRLALIDAGYEDGNFDRENTCVILGCGGGVGDLGQQYAARSEIPRIIGSTSAESWERLPEWTEDSFPGMLLNVVAGRIASRFDLGGSNFTVDAACASSLAAIDLAAKELVTGQANVAIAGGVDTVQSPFAFSAFSKTQALSPRGKCHSFDQDADGIAISEGTGIVVLKRLADAKRDGDRIYAVIKAVSSSSDGKALGLTAPLPAGQQRAFQRAYSQAGFSPSTIDLYEAHGTGTSVGDSAELETLLQALQDHQATSKSCAIGSVKTMIGHTKSSAGAAALIKVALSLHHRVMPPHRNVENPLEPIQDENSPVYLIKDARPWIASPNYPRRGAVSAFGFGGTNFHAVLEEYSHSLSPEIPGGDAWSHELILLSAADQNDLQHQAQTLLAALEAGAAPRLRDLAYTYALEFERCDLKIGLSIVTDGLEALKSALAIALDSLRGSRTVPLPPFIKIITRNEALASGKVAFLFPGQGCQYPQMGREAALYLPEVRKAIEVVDAKIQGTLPKLISQYIYPPGTYSSADEAKQIKDLRATQVAQPALCALETGLLAFTKRLELKADMVAGHSYGEYTALMAAGCLAAKDYISLSALRGHICAQAFAESEGAMAAARLSREEILKRLENVNEVRLANHNAPLQVIISGKRLGVEQVVNSMRNEGLQVKMLDITGAFHTPFMTSAAEQLAIAIKQTAINVPQIPVYSNVTARAYDSKPSAIKEQLAQHMLAPVEFVQQIEQMYADGARVFIEIGPKSVLTKLTTMIMEGKEHLSVSLDGNGGGLNGLLQSLGQLAILGVKLNLSALFAERDVNVLDLSRLVATTSKPPLPRTAWLVNGGTARPHTEAVGHPGQRPHLNYETFQQTQEQTTKSQPIQAKFAPNSQPHLLTSLKEDRGRIPQQVAVRPSSFQSPIHVQSGSSPVDNGFSHSKLPLTKHSFKQNLSHQANRPNLTMTQEKSIALEAYQAYQETMRQFLSVQEQVMRQFLASIQGQPNSTSQSLRSQSIADSPLSLPQTSEPNFNGRKIPSMSAPPIIYSAPVSNGASSLFSSAQSPETRASITQNQFQPVAAASSNIPMMGSQKSNGRSSSSPTTTLPNINSVSVPFSTQAPTILTPGNSSGKSASSRNPASFDRASLTTQLLSLVSDLTGYPSDMLGLNQDLEAELGIDSIKRVEIVGSLLKSLPAQQADRLNRQMENLTSVKSLNALIEQLLAVLSPSSFETENNSLVLGNNSGASSALISLPAFDRASLTEQLLKLVSELTGYPADMLGLNQDLEAELGIDSIKRVEIVGSLLKSLPAQHADRLNQQMESLTAVKSLNALIEQLLASIEGDFRLGKPRVGGGVGTNSSSTLTLTNLIEQTPRYLMQAVQEDLPSREALCLQGLFLITEDSCDCASIVAEQLQSKGAICAILPRTTLLNRQSIKASVDRLRQRHGSIKGIVHLAGITTADLPESLSEWRNSATVQVKNFYYLLQLCSQDLQTAGKNQEAYILSASTLGGAFGRSHSKVGLPTTGGAVGILKTLVKEWAGVQAIAVDFEPHSDAQTLSNFVVQELLIGDRLEVGYPQNQRTIFKTVLAPLSTASNPILTPKSDWVILVTGGARGITAEVAEAIAQAKMTLILVGRSPQPASESPVTQGIDDSATLKRILIKQAIEQQIKVTPAQIESTIRQILRNREILLNIKRLGNSGAQIKYLSADVRQENELKTIIEEIYQRYGRLDAVIHGAGVIEDKLIVDKTPESFERVFDTKADSLYILARHLRPETLKLLVIFSSVAGRYGNRGQSDYGSVNEVINRFAWQLNHQWSSTRVVAINWGPWDTTGMASAEVKRQFRQQQIIPIPLASGRQFFLQEILHGCLNSAEVIAGEGPWEISEAALANENSKNKISKAKDDSISNYPLIRSELQLKPNGSVILDHALTVASDPYLLDYQIGGLLELSPVVALEWIAEFVQKAWSDWAIVEVRDLKVLQTLTIEPQSSKLISIKARASTHADSSSLSVPVELVNTQENISYYRASVLLRPQLAETSQVPFTALKQGNNLDAHTIYQQHLSKKQRLQLINQVNYLNNQGLDAQVNLSNPQGWLNSLKLPKPRWLFDPGLIDTASQLATIWGKEQQNLKILPAAYFKTVTRYYQPTVMATLNAALRITQVEQTTLTYDVVFFDRQNNVHFHLENIVSPCNS